MSATSRTILAALDSAASDIYFPSWYRGDNHDTSTPSTVVGTANDSTMHSVATDVIRLDGVPKEALKCKKFVEVTLPLVSVGKLCQHGMHIHFDEHFVRVYDAHGCLVVQGHRDKRQNIYLIPVGMAAPRVKKPPVTETANLAAPRVN